jgi:class 3 adenylate cyclase
VAGARSTRAFAFCDVVGSTALRQRLGDSVADRWFNDLFERIELVTTGCDGAIVKWLGDGAMAVFPSAGAALDAAVRMQEVAHAPGPHTDVAPARLRVGVSVGDVAEADGDWIGMPVVEAARLCDRAGDDEILASELTARVAGSRSPHETEPLGDHELKGIDGPVPVVRVRWSLPEAPPARHFPASLAAMRTGPFVGRRGLVAELHHAWTEGGWRALVVSGETGMGKSRLVAELAHLVETSGTAVVLGRCDQEVMVDYRPWFDALGALVGSIGDEHLARLDPVAVAELAAALPALGRRLAVPPSTGSVDADTRHAMIARGVVALLDAVSPVAVVLDDIQWIDRRSLQLLRQVVLEAGGGVAVIATYRDTDRDEVDAVPATLADLRRVEGVRRVALEGLDGPEVADFLAQASGAALDDDRATLAREVHERTAGNPLFVGELSRHLIEAGAFGGQPLPAGAAASVLPDGLREVIQRRLGTLGGDLLRTLQVAAAVGSRFDLEIVEDAVALSGGDGRAVLEHLEAADAAGLVAEAGSGFDFRHGVIREVVLDGLSAARRRRTHRDVVAVLEKKWARSLDRHVMELAHQHAQAQTPESASWQMRAATAAIDALDSAAAELADRGLGLLAVSDESDPVLECELLIARAAGKRLAGDETIDDARLAFRAAAALGEQDRMARALLTLSVRSTADSQADHVAFLTEGLALIDDESLLSRWSVEVAIAIREGLDDRFDRDVNRDRVLAVVPHLDPADVGACQLGMRCARSLTSSNHPWEAAPIAERFEAGCEGVDTEGFPVEVALSTMWLHLGDRDRSDALLDVAAGDRRRSYWFYDCQVRQRQVMSDLLDGRWAAAAEGIAEVLRIGGHYQNLLLSCAQQQAWLDRETGAFERNFENLGAYLELFPDFAAIRCVRVGELAEAGRFSEARAELDALAPDDFRAAGRGWLTLLSFGNLASAAITVDAAEHAPVLRRVIEPMAGQMAVIATGTNVMCAVDRLLGGLEALAGAHDAADVRFAAALAQEQAMRSRPLEARTRHWWGRALRRRGDDRAARPHLARAADLAVDLGMVGLEAQLASE